MKKYIKVIFLLIVAIIPLILPSISIQIEAYEGEDALTAYAYELRLVRYEKQGDTPEYVGGRILIYNPEIFADIKAVSLGGGGDIPQSYDDFYSRSFSSISYIDASSNDNIFSAAINQQYGVQFLNTTTYTDGFGGADDILTSASYSSTFGEQAIPQNVTAETTSSDALSYGQFTCGYELYPYVSFYGKKSKDPATGQTKENFKYYYYYSDEKRGNYYGKDVIALDDNGNQITYNDMIPDSDLTQYNVENNGYVDTLLRRYGDSIPKIQQYFGYTIGDTEVHKYYVEAVPVVRVLEQNTSKSLASRAYLAHTYSKSEGEIYTWGPGDWENDTPHCSSGTLGGDGMCHKTECQCPAGVSCNDSCESCTQTYSDPCQTSCSTGISYGICFTGWPPKVGSYCRYTDESCTSHLADVTSIPEERFKLELFGTAYYKWTIKHLIYGTEYDLPSYLVTAQYAGDYLNRAVNTCSNNQHCIYQENTDICTDQYEYYVGPNKENALVGLEAYNPYTLAGCPGANGATYGRQHIYLANVINERCINGVLCCRTEVCSNILAQYGDRSDEYLACSENFCEATVDFDRKGNARNLKRSCILHYCGYSYGIDPDDPGNLRSANRQSVDSCANSPIAKKYASNPLNSESACNKSGDDPMQNKKGTNAEKCVGDSVTDFNMDISLDTVFEQRSYINKVCRDEVGFEYTDLSEVKLPVAGTGFSYPIIESGNRNCTYFINLEQWKFDYATVPARDPLNRKRMLYILDMYNQETNSEKKGNKKASPYYDAAFETAFAGDLEKYGKTYYEAEGFDFSNTEISVNITEKVIDKTATTNHPQNMLILATDKVENGEYAINNSISAFKSVIAMRLKSKVQIGSINEATRDAVTIVEKGQIVGKKDVERYETQAKGSITYGLEKSCMSTDGQSVVTKTTNNICGTNANGEPIYADNKFYTSFNIKTNYLNPVNTRATVAVTSSENGTVEYYKNLETCSYEVGDNTTPTPTPDPNTPNPDPKEGVCWLVLEKTEEGKQIKSNEIEGNSVKVKLRYDIPQKKTSSGIIDNGVKTDLEEITIRRNTSKSVDEHKLKGEVTYKGIDGAMHTVTCPNEIALEIPGGTCPNVSCEIIKNNEKEYEIKTTGAIVKYSYFTSQVKEFDLAKKYTTNITPRIDGRVIVGLSEALGSEDYIHGYVETSNPRCNAHCRYPSNDGGGGNPDHLNCYEIFDPIEVEDIYDYCHKDENIEKDINNFIDGDDCYKKCSAMCQNDRCDIEAATKHCEKWEEIGFPSKNMCMTTCSRDCPETEEEIPKTNQNPYLFRTVSVLNPFPSSQESEYPYEKGNRKVGSNWRYLSEYITNDEDDTTTVTGQNSLNNQVEYIIDLTPADIKRIREDTASLGANNGNNEKRKRAVYAKLDRVKTSSKAVTAYKSNFLHNSEFTKIFKPNHESTVSTFTP